MAELVDILIIPSLLILALSFVFLANFYQKIINFYLIFSNIVILIVVNSISKFDYIFDIIILLFLLELVAIFFLLSDQEES